MIPLRGVPFHAIALEHSKSIPARCYSLISFRIYRFCDAFWYEEHRLLMLYMVKESSDAYVYWKCWYRQSSGMSRSLPMHSLLICTAYRRNWNPWNLSQILIGWSSSLPIVLCDTVLLVFREVDPPFDFGINTCRISMIMYVSLAKFHWRFFRTVSVPAIPWFKYTIFYVSLTMSIPQSLPCRL